MAYEKVDLENKALVYLGDGYLRRDLEEYVKEKKLEDVYFLGFKNQTAIPGYYVMSDIFVLPSTIGETWGLVVNEAMCFHLPVIVSDMVGCVKDLVRHGENGFIFKTRNIDELSGYLIKLLLEPELRAKMGKRSLEIIAKCIHGSINGAALQPLSAGLSRLNSSPLTGFFRNLPESEKKLKGHMINLY